MEIQLEYGTEVHICFIDYSKAFDCINHELLWKTLLEMGIPKHLIQLLMGVRNPYLEFVWVLVCLCIFSMCIITLKDNTFQNYNAQEKLKKIKHINMNSPSVQIHGAQRNFDLTVCTNPRCTKKLLNSLSDLRP